MKINEATFQFLANLKVNNNREWFNANKFVYEQVRDNFKGFIQALIVELSTFDSQINLDINASKCMFRIYRDVRFSNDKSPYKSWLAAGLSIDGRKLEGPEYYIHIEPGKCFAAVGYWRPKKEHLNAIRQEIDYDFDQFSRALLSGGWNIHDLSQEDKLQKPPSGYTIENPAIEIIKLKSFIIYKPFTNEELTKSTALESMVSMFRSTLGFKEFLEEAIK